MAYFKNPQNGYVEKVTTPFSWVGFLVLGPIYFAIKGLWGHAVVSFFVLGPVWTFSVGFAGESWWIPVGIVYAIYSIGVYPAVDLKYKRMGWMKVDRDGNELGK